MSSFPLTESPSKTGPARGGVWRFALDLLLPFLPLVPLALALLLGGCGIDQTPSTLMDTWAVSRSGVVENVDAGHFDAANFDLWAPTHKSHKAEIQWADAPAEIPDLKSLIAYRPGQNCASVPEMGISVQVYGAEMHFHNVKWTIFEKF